MSQHVDETAIAELRDIMGEDFGLLVETFINDSETRIVDIEKAIADGNAETLRTTAHGLKGSALNISAGLLTEYCKQLEYMGRDNQLENAADVFEKARDEFTLVRDYLGSL